MKALESTGSVGKIPVSVERMIGATIAVIEEALAVDNGPSPSGCERLASRQRRLAGICEAAPADGISEQ